MNEFGLPQYIAIISIIVTLSGIIIGTGYKLHQNRRRIQSTIHIDIKNKTTHIINLIVYNSGFRSVTIKKAKLIVNDEEIELPSGEYPLTPRNVLYTKPIKTINFPDTIQEGSNGNISYNTVQIANYLYYKKFRGTVQLQVYFETMQNKISKSESINFNIDEYLNIE